MLREAVATEPARMELSFACKLANPGELGAMRPAGLY